MPRQPKTSQKTETIVSEESPVEETVVSETQEVTFADMAEEFRRDMSEWCARARNMNSRFKKLEKRCHRELKAKRPRKAKNSDRPKNPSGFNKPRPVPQKLIDLLGLDAEQELPRTQVTKRLYQYFEDHDLYAEKDDGSKDKRRIIPDGKVRKMFGMSKGEEITFYTIQSHIKKLYPVAGAQEEEEEEEEDEKPKRRSRKSRERQDVA